MRYTNLIAILLIALNCSIFVRQFERSVISAVVISSSSSAVNSVSDEVMLVRRAEAYEGC